MKRTQMLSATATLLLIATAAQAQRGRDDHRGRQDQQAQAAPPVPQRPGDDNRARAANGQRQEIEQARTQQARAAEIENQRRAAQNNDQQRALQTRQREQQDQLERSRQQQERDRQFDRSRLEEQERLQAQQREQLRQAELRREEQSRVYDRDRDYRPGYDYRYNMGGVYRETNQNGVNLLRQAVDLGYQQGYRAGQIDRRDRVAPDYRRAFEYQNGNYGYSTDYVPQSDYSYYFREGFQRGYDDAYSNQARYGTFSNGNASILGSIVAGILGLTSIR